MIRADQANRSTRCIISMAWSSRPMQRRPAESSVEHSVGQGNGALTHMLSGKVALVTGGRGGIGRAICARFLREGAEVFAADLTEGGMLPGAADCGSFVRFDVTSEEEARAAMARVDRECGKLDILVNAAGIEIERTIEQTSLAEWNRIFAVNVTGTFLESKH